MLRFCRSGRWGSVWGVQRRATLAGHSKWANIKHDKAVADAKKRQLYSKMARAITACVREGGADLEVNIRLREVVERAKKVSVPKKIIERSLSVEKGGEGAASAFDLEGTGPGGSLVIMECLSDKKGRTVNEVRPILRKAGGLLGKEGSAAFNFARTGVVEVGVSGEGEEVEDEVMQVALDAGADDVEWVRGEGEDGEGEEVVEVLCEPGMVQQVREAFQSHPNPDLFSIIRAEVVRKPVNTITLEDEHLEAFHNMLEALENLDDVETVHHNVQEDEEEDARG